MPVQTEEALKFWTSTGKNRGFLLQAEGAEQEPEMAKNPNARASWLRIAERYRQLAMDTQRGNSRLPGVLRPG